MTKQNKTIIGVFAVAIVVAVAIFASQKTQPTPTSTALPASVIDATETLPGTNVTFGYPSQGFYGLGIKLFPLSKQFDPTLISGVTTNPTKDFSEDRTSEYVTMTVSLHENKSNQTLEQIIAGFPQGSTDQVYAKANGHLQMIGGHQYFIYKATEDVTALTAVSISKEGVINVMFAYKNADAKESQLAYQNNDALFTETLSHVTFK